MNAMEWNRDLRMPLADIRMREKEMTDKPDRGQGTVCLPELRRGNIGLVVATQIARWVAPENPLPGWHSPAQAWAQTRAQREWYREMEREGEMKQVNDLRSLESHLSLWTHGRPSGDLPVGYILSLEGADSILSLEHLEWAHAGGLRALGPAHYGPGRYANGTDSSGRMGNQGLALLDKMESLGIILDTTHLCDEAFWQAMEHFGGAVWASHNNCRTLVNHNRQYSDEQIRALFARDAVIGLALDAWMIVPGWERGRSTPEAMECSLERAIDHLDHLCGLAGDCLHVGIGSDLDGAFGKEQSPLDLESIADLQKIPLILDRRGYSSTDITNIMHGNWIRFLQSAWQY
jgi:membrane dipeptidase